MIQYQVQYRDNSHGNFATIEDAIRHVQTMIELNLLFKDFKVYEVVQVPLRMETKVVITRE